MEQKNNKVNQSMLDKLSNAQDVIERITGRKVETLYNNDTLMSFKADIRDIEQPIKEALIDAVIKTAGDTFLKYIDGGYTITFMFDTRSSDMVSEHIVFQAFDAEYGTDINQRMAKLAEEESELMTAYDYFKDNRISTEELIDEVVDVNIIAMHIAHILDMSIEECLRRAYKKMKLRKDNPDAQRTHSHKIPTCDKCRSYYYLTEYKGICNYHDTSVKPKDKSCFSFSAKKEN